MSVVAKVAMRSGAYLTLAGVCAAAMTGHEDVTLLEMAGSPSEQVAMIVQTGDADHVGSAVGSFPKIDMSNFSPGGEHWIKMNSDDPAIRQKAMDDLYAVYGHDFMMQPGGVNPMVTRFAARKQNVLR